MNLHPARLLASATVACLLILTGCSGDGAETDSGSTSAQSEKSSADGADTADTAGSGDGAEDGAANGAKAAGIDLDNPPKAIASMTVPGTPKGDVKDTLVELVRFEERGKVLLAVFRLTPHGTAEDVSANAAVQWDPTMVDLTNLKSYDSVSELTHGYLTDLVMNEPNYLMAGFAIPEHTDTIDIGVSDEGVRMEGVKLP